MDKNKFVEASFGLKNHYVICERFFENDFVPKSDYHVFSVLVLTLFEIGIGGWDHPRGRGRVLVALFDTWIMFNSRKKVEMS